MPRRKRPICDEPESDSDLDADLDSGNYGFPIPCMRPPLYRSPADPAEAEKSILYDTDEDSGDDTPERRRLTLALSEAVDYSTPDGQPLRYKPDTLAKMMGNGPAAGGAVPAVIPQVAGVPGDPAYDAARQAAQQAGAFFFMGLPVEIRQRIMAPDLIFPGVIFQMPRRVPAGAGDNGTKGVILGHIIFPVISYSCPSPFPNKLMPTDSSGYT